MSEIQLLADLDALGVAWQLHEHSPVFTVEESAPLHQRLPGAHTKNLFLEDARGGFWLVTTGHDLRVDLKALAGALEARKFSFGKAASMTTLLGVAPGAVTPLAAINDAGGKVQVVLDEALADAALVNVHPLRNTATLALPGRDLLRALAYWCHPATVIAIPGRP